MFTPKPLCIILHESGNDAINRCYNNVQVFVPSQYLAFQIMDEMGSKEESLCFIIPFS